METDLVCGMQIEKTKATVEVIYKGKTYYLCSMACKDKFVQNPKKYVGGVYEKK